MGIATEPTTRRAQAPRLLLALSILVGWTVLTACDGGAPDAGGEAAPTASAPDADGQDGVGRPFGGPLAPDATLRETLQHPDPLVRVQRVAQILQSATPDDLPEIRAEFERAPQAWGDLEYALFAGWWARFDPNQAMAYCENDVRADHPRVYADAMRSWGRMDPQGAVDSGWLGNINLNFPGWRAEMVEALVTGWFESGNPGLEEWIKTEVETNSVVPALRAYVRLRVLRDGPRETLDWSRTAPFEEEDQRVLFANALNAVARMDPKLAVEYLALAEKDGIDTRTFVARIARGWAHIDPNAAMEWVSTTNADPVERDRAVRDMAKIWLIKDAPGFEAWLAERGEDPSTDSLRKQAIYHHVTTNDYRVDWLAQMKRASEFKDPEARKMEYLWLIQRWKAIDPEPANAWLAENEALLGDKLPFADQLFKHDREAIDRILAREARAKAAGGAPSDASR